MPAGLEPRMNVLDLGCGMGDVSLLAARLVGPTGRVTGIDRDPVVVEKARERAQAEGGGSQIEFIQAELLKFHSHQKFDAVVGRYVLLFQPDPVAAIIHAAKQVRSGGIIVFHEMDLANRIRSYPDGTLFGKVYALIAEMDRLGGVQTDLGLHLTRLFLDAGLPCPRSKLRFRSAENLASSSISGSPRQFALSCRALSSLVWQPRTNCSSTRLWQEWRPKPSISKLNLSVRFSLGLGLGMYITLDEVWPRPWLFFLLVGPCAT